MLALANKLSLNTRPIYRFVNKYSIDFDGVDDCIITDGADTVAQPTTYSFWCKSSTTGTNTVFGHGGQNIGAFYLNFSNKPLIFLGTNYYRWWNDVTQQDDGEWHHWVVYADTNDVTNSKLYCDGVLQTVYETATNGTLEAYTESLTIGGTKATGGAYLEGKIDEFAVYDRELTQAEITRMYNSGTPINLNLNASAYQSANPLITSTKSMEFDGVDDYLIANSTLGSFTGSFSCWVNRDNNTGFQYLLDARGSSNGGTGYIHFNNSDTLLPSSGTKYVDGVAATEVPTDGRWHHVVVAGITLNINEDITLGARYSIANFLNGKMTEVGLWDRTLTALEVASLYNQGMPTNLLVNRNNYQSGNPTVFNTKLVDFDGTDDYAVAGLGSPLVTGSGAITMSVWVITDQATSNFEGAISVGEQGAPKSHYLGRHSSDNWGAGIYGNDMDSGVAPVVNEWTHLVYTYAGGSGGAMKLYVNGVEKATNTGTANIPTSSLSGTYIGSIADNTSFNFNGKISQAGVWNEALTADEVSSLYNHGLPIDLTTDQAAYESSSNLVGYWRMGSGTLDSYPLIADQTNATLGAEEITGFTNGTTYPFTTFTTSGNNITSAIVSSDFAGAVSNAISVTLGEIYKVTFDYTKNSGDDLRIVFSSTVTGAGTQISNNKLVSSSGTYTKYFTITSTTTGYFQMGTGNSGHSLNASITNVSVKNYQGNPATMTNMVEGNITNQYPLTKIRNYYRMGDGILDGYPIIQDQTSPNLAHIPTTNLVTDSIPNNISWSKGINTTITENYAIAPDGTNTASRIITPTGSGTYAYIQFNASLNSDYTLSFYAKNNGGDADINMVFFQPIPQSNKQITLTNEWQRFEFTKFNVSSGTMQVGVDNITSFDMLLWGVQAEAQSQATAYIKSDGIAAVRKSSTTNTLPYSEDFSQWSLVNTTLTSGQASPDNNTNAYKLIPTSSNSIHSLRVFSVTGQTFSVTAKKGEYKNLLIWSDASSKGLGVNLDDNSIFRNVGVLHYNITELTDGWKRINVTLDASYTGTFAFYVYDNSATPQITFAGNGIDGLFIYAAQLEEQTQAETYAKTTGLPVTIDLFTENNYGTMTNMSASDIIEDTPNN